MSTSAFPFHPILLVDDDVDLQRSYALTLRNNGISNLVQCSDSRAVEQRLSEREYEVVLLDLNMPNVTGLDLLPIITGKYPDTLVVVITGLDEVNTAVDCMRAGAFDYLVKPVGEDGLIAVVRRAIDVRQMRRENVLLREHLLSAELSHPEAFAEIVTGNATMHTLFKYIEAVAGTPQPILVNGETGVGKELIARAIHTASDLEGAFVPVNIAGVDDNVFSDTLFGHVRGAFTGAVDARKGLIEQAANGTLFLDEIGDLNAMSQVKLLRLIQEREYFPLGSDNPRRTNARIIVATNRDLSSMQKTGAFRDDLYFRLRSHHIRVPPLRERKDDLPLLVDHFLSTSARAMKKKKPTPPTELYTLLTNYHFPGNIREMEAMFFNAVSTHSSGILDLSTFKDVISEGGASVDVAPARNLGTTCAASSGSMLFDPLHPLPSVRQAGELLIAEALRRTDDNQTMAAELLGITRQTLNRHLKKR